MSVYDEDDDLVPDTRTVRAFGISFMSIIGGTKIPGWPRSAGRSR
jgi:hypothetical protein